MSVVAISQDPLPIVPLFDRAVSPAAQRLSQQMLEPMNASRSWSTEKMLLGEAAIVEAIVASRGEGFVIEAHVIELAKELLWMLPSHVPFPTIVIEAHNRIAFDWDESSDRTITVSIDEHGYLGFAALVGLRPVYGRAPFAGSIPETVLSNLLRVYPLPLPRRRAG